jgi:general secretion pathway protein A
MPVVVAPVMQPLATLLAQSVGQTEPGAALGGLLKLWQGTYDEAGGDVCMQAGAQGLECVSRRSTLAQLREFNRPAVLALSDAERHTYQVLLTGLQSDQAVLQIGGKDTHVSIAELSAWWFGDLVLMWRPPVVTVNTLASGARGPAVRELRNRLRRWNGTVSVNSSMEFDAELAHMVEEFQQAHHLTPDGVAGLDTQLLLDGELAAPGSPLLRPTTEPR